MKRIVNIPTFNKLAPFGLGALILASVGCGGRGDRADSGGEMPPLPVTAVEIAMENIEVQSVYSARVRGFREVEVRARVGGILEERLYSEGAMVQSGEALFRIETEPFLIALQQAEAELANAGAQAAQAQREWRRISRLFEQNAVSERERDRALSYTELAEAHLKLARARVEEARLNLEYTTVKASISGSTGLEFLPGGSLVERGSLLTTIVQLDPVQVRFSIPERDMAILRTAAGGVGDRADNLYREVSLLLPDGRLHERGGVLDFTDSAIDPRTGSVQARAVFDNPDGKLVPGQFVRVRLLLQDLTGVAQVDPAAIAQGPDGPFVFLAADNTVEARPVRLGPMVDGRRVVLEGLASGDRLIISGLAMLQPGMPVSPRIIQND